GGVAGHALAQDRLRDSDRRVGRGGADLRGRLRLGLGDLGLGSGRAAGHEIRHALVRLLGRALRLLASARDNRLGLALGLLAPAAVVGEHLRRLLAQALGLVEFGLDALAAMIEALEEGLEAAHVPYDP